MVDKVDRPEAPPAWKIKEPARTKDDRRSRQQEESKEQKKEKFEKRGDEGRWRKFDSRTMVIKPILVPLRDIRSFRFSSVTIHSGVATMEADLEWNTGRVTEGTMVRLGGFDEYIKAKRMNPGDLVPREMWAKSDPLEVGIPQARGPSGSYAVQDMERQQRQVTENRPDVRRSWLTAVGLRNKETGQFQWSTLILYIIIATGLGLALHALLTMTRI